MTIYNLNLGIGWASSGVEYAQAYRGQLFRKLGLDTKFIFTDFFVQDNLSDLTRNLGFLDEEIIWLYGYFTDVKVAPSSYRLSDLLANMKEQIRGEEVTDQFIRYFLGESDHFMTVYLSKKDKEAVHCVEYVHKGNLVRKDVYSYTKIFSEYYTPKEQAAHLYLRRFFNEDGSVAYDEIIDGPKSMFKFPKAILYSKEELISYFMQDLNLTANDLFLLDRATGTGQSVFRYHGQARLGVVIHAEHYSPNYVTDDTILWNNFYDYQFVNADKVDFFLTSTQRQKEVLEEQFLRYTGHVPRVIAIPVGSLDQLKGENAKRKPYSILTASRLATEKHVDWLTRAVIAAKKELPNLTFDIYGQGGEWDKIDQIIREARAEDSIRLMGHHQLADVYQQYELYLTASKSEGFGLTLLEAVGSGLPLIGFDVPYGNQTFVKEGQNGYLLPCPSADDETAIVAAYQQAIVTFFRQADREVMRQTSYRLAEGFLTSKVEEAWLKLVKEMTANDNLI